MPEKKCYQSNMAERVYKPPLADRWRETLRLAKPGRDRDFQIIRFRLASKIGNLWRGFLEMRGMASAMVGLVRNFGMVFGTAFSGALLALRPDSLLSGFHLAMEVGAIVALAGVALGAFQATESDR